MQQTPTVIAPPARWERISSAFLFLMAPITLTGLVLGLLAFAALRRRSPYTAQHGLQVALWQVVFNILALLVYLGSLPFGLTRTTWGVTYFEYLLPLQQTPAQFPALWQMMPPQYQAVTALVLALLLLSLAVAVIGVITSLRGRTFALPRLGRLPRESGRRTHGK